MRIGIGGNGEGDGRTNIRPKFQLCIMKEGRRERIIFEFL